MRASRSPAIPTASMADVAFLLLLFFLVATAIRTETGVPIALPGAGPHEPAPESPRTLAVLVDAAGTLRLGDAVVTPEAARAEIAEAVAVRPVVVSLQAHRRTPYDAYVDVLDAVLMGHRDAGVAPRLSLRDPAGAR